MELQLYNLGIECIYLKVTLTSWVTFIIVFCTSELTGLFTVLLMHFRARLMIGGEIRQNKKEGRNSAYMDDIYIRKTGKEEYKRW